MPLSPFIARHVKVPDEYNIVCFVFAEGMIRKFLYKYTKGITKHLSRVYSCGRW